MPRIASIEYIRGLAMLGVIGIHTGAWSLSNSQVNMHLFALRIGNSSIWTFLDASCLAWLIASSLR